MITHCGLNCEHSNQIFLYNSYNTSIHDDAPHNAKFGYKRLSTSEHTIQIKPRHMDQQTQTDNWFLMPSQPLMDTQTHDSNRPPPPSTLWLLGEYKKKGQIHNKTRPEKEWMLSQLASKTRIDDLVSLFCQILLYLLFMVWNIITLSL